MTLIHPNAIVDAKARIDDGVEIGPFAVIGPAVTIESGTRVGAHAVITGHTTIGRDNVISPFVSLGGPPQDKKYAGEPTELRIGARNVIREYCTFNIGTVQDGGVTRVGDDNWVMAYVHVAHDCQIGNKTILANAVQLAGHVQIGDWVFLGGLTGVHQFVKIGAHAMTSASSYLSQDLPPYVTGAGSPTRAAGINTEGLRRRGFDATAISLIRQAYKLVYRNGLTLADARAAIDALSAENPGHRDALLLFNDFLAQATRGIVR